MSRSDSTRLSSLNLGSRSLCEYISSSPLCPIHTILHSKRIDFQQANPLDWEDFIFTYPLVTGTFLVLLYDLISASEFQDADYLEKSIKHITALQKTQLKQQIPQAAEKRKEEIDRWITKFQLTALEHSEG